MDPNQNNPQAPQQPAPITPQGQDTPQQQPTPPPPAPPAPDVGQTEAPAQSAPPPVYGSFIYRWAALTLDNLIVSVIAGPLSFLTFKGTGTAAVFTIIYMLSYNIYAAIMDVYYGTTLGKKVFGMYVAKEDGSRLQMGDAVMREILGKIVSGLALNLGFIWVAFDEKKQGWHDKIAKTFVFQSQVPSGGLKALAWFLVIGLPVLGLIIIIIFGAIIFAALGSAGKPNAQPQQQQLQQLEGFEDFSY